MSKRQMIAKLHIAKKALALDDDSYRAVLTRAAGKSSSGDMNERELDLALKEFNRLGWSPTRRPQSPKRHVRHVYALWREAGEVGAIGSATRAALRAFVERQTGVADPEWLTAPDATKVAEGLKAMIRRAKQAKAA